MAVLQISRIQVRRGKKNSGTGIPQLSSGEFGWAVDTQELYIGNGSVLDGAPNVGNTRVLTENDYNTLVQSVFDTILQSNPGESITQLYQYRPMALDLETGLLGPTIRPLQSRLDDIVSAKAFGVNPDGVTDNTGALQLAFDQLYLNNVYRSDPDNDTWKVVLNLEPGIYVITGVLEIPPFVTLRGAGIDKTFIRQIGEGSVTITTINDNNDVDKSLTTTTYANQPRHIEISNLTIENYSNEVCLELNAVRNSLFENVKFKSSWDLDSSITDTVGVNLIAKSSMVTCEKNVFKNCTFENLKTPVTSDYDIQNNVFVECTFTELKTGIKFGINSNGTVGQEFGPRNNKIVNSFFSNIEQTGIDIVKGTGNISLSNTFKLVGNDGGPTPLNIYPIINFVEPGNISRDDFFDRSIEFGSTNGYTNYPYQSEITGSIISENRFNKNVNIEFNEDSTLLLRLPGDVSAIYLVHYSYISPVAEVIRQGTIKVVVDLSTLSPNVLTSEEFDVTGALSNALNFMIEGAYIDSDADSVGDTVTINYTNSTENDIGVFHYWYETIN